jgi:hypothetical protein
MNRKRLVSLLFALALIISLGTAAYAQQFTDVPAGHAYKAAIDYCQTENIVKGVGGDKFMPDATLTRAQFATLWCRSLKLNEINHSFTDITKLKNYYDSPAIVLNSLGIFKGVSTDKFSPDGLITREQLAVATMRTYAIEAADMDDYKQYTDHESISSWAREAVSACINAEVFKNLYDGDTFKPQEPVTRGEVCQLIFNLFNPGYIVMIDEMEGGTITANPEIADAGDTITLTITPDTGKQLKSGTLKFNDTPISGTTFTMPAEDVLITAEFEDAT